MLSFILACTLPELHSPYDSAEEKEWTIPNNQWPSSAPPNDLKGEGFASGETATDIHFIDQYGDEVSLWQFYGNVVLFDISSSWCSRCKIIAQEVEAMQAHYGSEGFVYLTLIAEGFVSEEAVAQELIVQWASDYHIENAPVLRTERDHRPELVPLREYPRLFLIDREMTIVDDNVNSISEASIRESVEEAL